MKLLTTLLMAILGALIVYMARRRILFALKTGAILYIVLLIGRVILSMGSLADRWEDLIVPACIGLAGWSVLWWLSTSYAERRDRQKKTEVRLARTSSKSLR